MDAIRKFFGDRSKKKGVALGTKEDHDKAMAARVAAAQEANARQGGGPRRERTAAELEAAQAALLRLSSDARKPHRNPHSATSAINTITTPTTTPTTTTPTAFTSRSASFHPVVSTTSASPKQPSLPVTSGQGGIFYFCPLTAERVPVNDIRQHIITELQKMIAESPQDVLLCARLICTASIDPAPRQICLETLTKYLSNLATNPTDAKFKKIRVGNRAFQERVASVVGGLEFIAAAGFSAFTEEGEDSFINYEGEVDVQRLGVAIDVLASSSPLKGTLDRNERVYAPSQLQLPSFEITPDFFQITKEDIIAAAATRKEQAERESTLRTQAMRDAEKEKTRRTYLYTVLRVRMPDGHILQGTFAAHETVQDIAQFVQLHLAYEGAAEFHFQQPGTSIKYDNPTQTLREAGLVPSTLLVCVQAPSSMVSLELKPEVVTRAKQTSI